MSSWDVEGSFLLFDSSCCVRAFEETEEMIGIISGNVWDYFTVFVLEECDGVFGEKEGKMNNKKMCHIMFFFLPFHRKNVREDSYFFLRRSLVNRKRFCH